MERDVIKINYNTLKELPNHPLDSLTYQELKNFKIIIVDDNGQVLQIFVPEDSTETCLCEIELDHSPIPYNCPSGMYEIIIKGHGRVWKIHKSDKDWFPSNPHAHDEITGLKINLANGDLFSKREYRGSINKKDLMDIRNKMIKKGIQPPELS